MDQVTPPSVILTMYMSMKVANVCTMLLVDLSERHSLSDDLKHSERICSLQNYLFLCAQRSLTSNFDSGRRP